jgi:hypothetical protein
MIPGLSVFVIVLGDDTESSRSEGDDDNGDHGEDLEAMWEDDIHLSPAAHEILADRL